MSWGLFPLLLAASCLSAADLPDVAARIGAFATEFQAKARMAMSRRALHGALYVRASDCLPLRITASFETRAVLNRIRDDATVDFVRAPFGAPVPATVVHRHIINDRVLTENLYTYAPFRLFGSDSTIRYADRPLTGRQ